MPRRKEPYSIIRRSNSAYWYFKIEGQKSYKSTGLPHDGKEKPGSEVRRYVLAEYEKHKSAPAMSEVTLREYAEPFYIWETCPHVQRLVSANKTITLRHVRNQRSFLKHVFNDVIAEKKISEIRRGDVEDFRGRLVKKMGYCRTVQCVMGVLKTIFKEGVYREDLVRDPTAGVDKTKYEPKERGMFTIEELRRLFEENVWKDSIDRTMFMTAAMTGMRRGEVLALTWEQVSFRHSTIAITRALKGQGLIDLPKWQKTREIPISRRLVRELTHLRACLEKYSPDRIIFSWDEGTPLSTGFWKGRFNNALKKAGILEEERKNRNLSPHSLRHSLNTHLLHAGADPVKIALYMGWSLEKTILSSVQAGYFHASVEQLKPLINTINAIFS